MKKGMITYQDRLVQVDPLFYQAFQFGYRVILYGLCHFVHFGSLLPFGNHYTILFGHLKIMRENPTERKRDELTQNAEEDRQKRR